MNRYLDDETKKAIEAKALRFDDEEIPGKTVAKSCYMGSVAGISFTDGTWCAVEAVDDCGEPDIFHVGAMDLYDLLGLGLITQEQFAAAQARERDGERERKRKQIERLQAEIKELKSER